MDEVPATGKMATGQPGAGEPVEVAAEPGHNGASAIDRATSGQPDRYRAAPGSIPFRRLPARGPFPDVATEEPLSLKRNALWPKAAMNGSRPRPRSSARVLDLLNASWPDGLLTGPWPREAVNEPWPGSGRPGATPREATAEPARPGDRPAPAHPAEGDAPVGDPAVGAPAVGDPGEPAVELPWAMEESVHDLPEPVELPDAPLGDEEPELPIPVTAELPGPGPAGDGGWPGPARDGAWSAPDRGYRDGVGAAPGGPAIGRARPPHGYLDPALADPSPGMRAARVLGMGAGAFAALVVVAMLGLTALIAATAAQSTAGQRPEFRPGGVPAPGAPAPGVPAADAAAGGTAAGGTRHLVSAPLAGRQAATLDLVNGATTVYVRAGDLGADLYRVSTPEGSSTVPRVVDQAGALRVHLAPVAETGQGPVEIALSTRVRWHLRLTGGAVEQVVDLTGVRLAGVELAGGVTRVELTLPRPEGTVGVRMTGGVNEFIVHLPERVAVRTRVGAGAGQVTVDGRTHGGAAPSSTFGSPDWSDARDRFDIDAVAGVGALTVDRD